MRRWFESINHSPVLTGGTMHTEGKLLLSGATVYELMRSGWRNGEEQFTNKFSFRVYADKDAGVSEEEIARRLVTCWNEHDDLVKERDALKKRVAEMHDGGMRIIQDYTERTKEAIKLREERDELVSVLRELAHGEYSDEIGNRAIALLAKYPEQP